jgi:hypothetical protein
MQKTRPAAFIHIAQFHFAAEYDRIEKKNDNEFVTGKMLNANLLAARDAYRKQCGLLTSDEISSIWGKRPKS